MQIYERDRFAADELAVVLSHYDLGVIESITEFARGSRRSPKVGIVAARGKFLLKRRAPARSGTARVEFAHRLQIHLAAQQFPLPKLIRPLDSAETALTLGEYVYELFEFVGGQPFHGAPDETRDAGHVLARFHELARQFEPPPDHPRGDYHDALTVRTGLNAMPATLNANPSTAPPGSAPADRGAPAETAVKQLTELLFDAYDQAGEAADSLGLPNWPEQVIHSDWHPGNMLFRGGEVAAVIDYDSARISRRIIDIANGALQFSMLSGSHPDAWPAQLDEPRLTAFVAGYERRGALTETELRSLPHLMIEALIAESVVPIAATGVFGRFKGFGFMQMVQRKVAWLQQHGARLVHILRE
ncbi:MAG TPA: phosphotransferase [Phycisphaerae bacterium]